MSDFKHRSIYSQNFMGEEVKFIKSNDRVVDRVKKLSNERTMIESMLTVSEPDDVVWDIGACLGIHTFICALHVPYGSVVSFEPMPVNRGVLVDNMHANQIDNVEVYEYAMADSVGKTEFSIRESIQAGFGRHGIKNGDYDEIKEISVNKMSGDVFSKGKTIPNIVKIDVEGASPLVLRGMEGILKNDNCREVYLETHEPNPVQPSHEDFGWTRDDIISFLEDCGFRVGTVGEKFLLHATKGEFMKMDFEQGSYNINDTIIDVERGDISERNEDAIINSAGTSLRMGSGVAGSLRKKGGESLNRKAVLKGPVDIGSAIVTDSYGLDCRKVIHSVSMPHYGSGKSTPDTISQAVRNALETAEELDNVHEIALPAIGCGIAGVPLTQGAPKIVKEICNAEIPSIDRIVLVGYTDEEYRTIRRVVEDIHC